MLPIKGILCGALFLAWTAGLPGTNAWAQEGQPPTERPAAKNTCLDCHSSLGGQLAVPTVPFPTDVHAGKGLTCASCHGGDPTSMDMQVAMSHSKEFRGRPTRQQIPAFCGRCHSDPAYMHQFSPTVETDQLSQYATSVHGRRLREGDTRVATCIDCHSVHDIKLVSDPTAPVYPSNVPDTCGKCHNEVYMEGYDLPNFTQIADYKQSMHYRALTEDGDLSAPTCVTCHGSHGALPPGVRSVADVCGSCHANNQKLFRESPHAEVYAAMEIPGCVQCHGNHAVLRAGEDMLAGADSVCLGCHAPDDAGAQRAQEMAGSIQKLEADIERARQTLEQADLLGMDVSSATVNLTEAHNNLILSRTETHSLDMARLATHIDGGTKVTDQVLEEGKEKLAEVQSRRKGLALSSLFILVVVVSLYFYIRQNGQDKLPQG